jgi:hypothetical protein
MMSVMVISSFYFAEQLLLPLYLRYSRHSLMSVPEPTIFMSSFLLPELHQERFLTLRMYGYSQHKHHN